MKPIELTRQARPVTTTVDAINEHGETVATAIAGEHPLTLYLDKRELSQEQLVTELRALHDANAELRVFIHGDESARLGLAIAVLDETRKLGITKVAFETRAKP